MPNVVVIAGPNGAGKSTLAPALLRDTFGVLEYVSTYWMAGIEHVRETIPFPRMLYRLKP
ncbi:MAG TPA: hypothetical protein VFO86_08565 [Terriglobia bacterium]|nr:hypothetical protein [Terriglobia bacterium]